MGFRLPMRVLRDPRFALAPLEVRFVYAHIYNLPEVRPCEGDGLTATVAILCQGIGADAYQVVERALPILVSRGLATLDEGTLRPTHAPPPRVERFVPPASWGVTMRAAWRQRLVRARRANPHVSETELARDFELGYTGQGKSAAPAAAPPAAPAPEAHPARVTQPSVTSRVTSPVTSGSVTEPITRAVTEAITGRDASRSPSSSSSSSKNFDPSGEREKRENEGPLGGARARHEASVTGMVPVTPSVMARVTSLLGPADRRAAPDAALPTGRDVLRILATAGPENLSPVLATDEDLDALERAVAAIGQPRGAYELVAAHWRDGAGLAEVFGWADEVKRGEPVPLSFLVKKQGKQLRQALVSAETWNRRAAAQPAATPLAEALCTHAQAGIARPAPDERRELYEALEAALERRGATLAEVTAMGVLAAKGELPTVTIRRLVGAAPGAPAALDEWLAKTRRAIAQATPRPGVAGTQLPLQQRRQGAGSG